MWHFLIVENLIWALHTKYKVYVLQEPNEDSFSYVCLIYDCSGAFLFGTFK